MGLSDNLCALKTSLLFRARKKFWQRLIPGRIMQLMLNAGSLTFKEFAMQEPLPLATIHDAVLEFLRGREDIVVFGATAVNAYVSEPRMTQDIDIMSTHA